MGIVESANALLLTDFQSAHLSPAPIPLTFTVPGNQDEEAEEEYTITLSSAGTIPTNDLHACYALIKATSKHAYKNSEVGWSSVKKAQEMTHKDMRYLLVKRGRHEQEQERGPGDGGLGGAASAAELMDPTKDTSSETSDVVAFLSFILTYEDGCEVIYCYELHVRPALRRCGLGRRLMDLMENVGAKVGVEKAMLTVFRSNEDGVGFYRKRGYVFGFMEFVKRIVPVNITGT
ncbi:MAG: hypothetical protein M1816_001330 [Peltula sp. TS41687]|nr:MAG: hypothetical protein M1816_001330 [Peltula sp. TS41687]